jgi:hypothetical protein
MSNYNGNSRRNTPAVQTVEFTTNSERSRFSGSAIELATILSAGSSPLFEPLFPLFMPTLLGLCSRANTAFTRKAKVCTFALIENTRLDFTIPYKTSKSQTGLVAFSSCKWCARLSELLQLPHETCARLIEGVIKLTARDARTDVRKVGQKAYKFALDCPERFSHFLLNDDITYTYHSISMEFYLNVHKHDVQSAHSQTHRLERSV